MVFYPLLSPVGGIERKFCSPFSEKDALCAVLFSGGINYNLVKACLINLVQVIVRKSGGPSCHSGSNFVFLYRTG